MDFLDVYLIKKDNDGTSSNNAGKINLNDENYKGENVYFKQGVADNIVKIVKEFL